MVISVKSYVPDFAFFRKDGILTAPTMIIPAMMIMPAILMGSFLQNLIYNIRRNNATAPRRERAAAAD